MEHVFAAESYKIMGAAFTVYKTLQPGFTEYVYQDALEIEFKRMGIPYEREKRLKVYYDGIELQHDFYADFVCYDCIIVELKAVAELQDVHKAQVRNYLRATNMRLGIVLNFGADGGVEHCRVLNSTAIRS